MPGLGVHRGDDPILGHPARDPEHPVGGVLELFETEAHRSDVPRSRPADCGLLRATLRNQHIASVIVFTECGQIQFSAAVDTGARPNDCDQTRADDVPIPRASASGVHVRAVPGYKSGTNRITQHHPTSPNVDQHQQASLQVDGRFGH